MSTVLLMGLGVMLAGLFIAFIVYIAPLGDPEGSPGRDYFERKVAPEGTDPPPRPKGGTCSMGPN